MDIFAGLIGWLFRALVVEMLVYTLLYGIGWLVLKALTLGRHPQRPRGVGGWLEVELVALVGLLAVVVAAVAFVRLAG
ncbi:hypothetical protein AWV79_26530 [Cupriavidus sp. UYMMa02A]|nr:hypothetical protein AWV79_26530 [Cupriavidus sp. UYMMa02A]